MSDPSFPSSSLRGLHTASFPSGSVFLLCARERAFLAKFIHSSDPAYSFYFYLVKVVRILRGHAGDAAENERPSRSYRNASEDGETGSL